MDFRGTWVHVNGYLSRFLFRAEQGKLRVGQLSGGEQSRLALARLMLRPANVLVLDEPTNDLDLATLDVLEDTLINFDGAVLLVSHDRYFLDRGQPSFSSFHTRPEETKGASAPSGGPQAMGKLVRRGGRGPLGRQRKCRRTQDDCQAPAPTPRRKLSYIDQREWDGIETRIAEAEAVLGALRAEQASPEVASNHSRLVELEVAIVAAKAKVNRLYARWAKLESLIPR